MNWEQWVLFSLNSATISALDTVSCSILIDKLMKYRLNKCHWSGLKITADLKMLWSTAQSPAWSQSLVVYPREQQRDEYTLTSLMSWMMGQYTLSRFAGDIKLRERWLICQMAILLFRGTLMRWRNGLSGTSWSSSLGNTKPCNCRGISSCISAHWVATDWTPAYWEKTWQSCWTPS